MKHEQYIERRDEILEDYKDPSEYGTSNYGAQKAIDQLVLDVIGEDRLYDKYGACPTCNREYQYTCGCDEAEFKVKEAQRKIVSGDG